MDIFPGTKADIYVIIGIWKWQVPYFHASYYGSYVKTANKKKSFSLLQQ